MEKKDDTVSWRTVLKFMGELPPDEWITARKFSELFYIPYKKSLFHLLNLYNWTMLNKRKIPNSKNTVEYKISNRGREKLVRIKDRKWCDCNDDSGNKCIGCMIEMLVSQNLGEEGLQYLKSHFQVVNNNVKS